MKKNRFVITTILIVTLILIGLFLILKPDQPESIGRYIRTSAGSHMILLENSPIIMSNHSESENLFDGLNTGDEIKTHMVISRNLTLVEQVYTPVNLFPKAVLMISLKI